MSISAFPRLGPRARARLLGVSFLGVLVLLAGLSVAFYRKTFTPVVRVTLVAGSVGNQLAPGADVKIRGLVVGEVRSVRSTGDQARVELALDPDLVGEVPANVQARLLPKTLFGERYVSLLVPDGQPAGQPLVPGATIHQDRSFQAVEIEQVLHDLLPLLRTVSPGKLNATLHALATALEGRGEQLGNTLVTAEGYLRQLNTRLPAILRDVSALAGTADVYNSAAPDLFAVLTNLQTTERTITERQAQLAGTLRAGTRLGATAQPFLAANADRLIRASALLRPTLAVLAEFAPEYPCFFQGLVRDAGTFSRAFGAGTNQPGVHATVELISDRGGYRPGEEPRHHIMGTASCGGLPNPPVPFPAPYLDDGSHGVFGAGTGSLGRALSADLGVQGSEAETRLVKGLLAPTIGVPPDQVPDTAAILFAPMARGTQVRLS
ncbi:MAG TPA: MCE family protein [Mycobacteriales bacterium]|nr:MCE family protein [Mycobacteriales bacterium]